MFDKMSIICILNLNRYRILFIDAIRYSVIDNFESIVSNKLCQKLIPYTPNYLLGTKDLVENLHCPEGKVGPYCSISCQHHLNVSVDCKGIKICDAKDCKCPPGFMGKNCEASKDCAL